MGLPHCGNGIARTLWIHHVVLELLCQRRRMGTLALHTTQTLIIKTDVETAKAPVSAWNAIRHNIPIQGG